MSGRILLDSNTVMYLFNSVIPLESFKQAFNGAEQMVSIITELELLSFPRLSEEQETDIRRFLTKRAIIPLTDKIKEKTIEFRRRTNRKLPDSIIAATSIVCEAVLITGDKDLLKLSFPGLRTVSAPGGLIAHEKGRGPPPPQAPQAPSVMSGKGSAALTLFRVRF
ncbi:MAG: type II toxin-antitoxin system VapC family toxin [Spirochaetaceae bacterium]|jgi:predicted nucleic acid-binding protein|nr:type II toxin-antitoxin system VapC family toxin [Spirochaetaceae bacterium]